LNIGCSICGWNEGRCDIHHIKGKKIKNADDHKNLILLCPNHHRLVHENKINIDNYKNIQETLGDSWKKYYFG